jgi:hypothetical protein
MNKTFDFRTVMYLYTILGIVVALLVHFVVLSAPGYNWFAPNL